MNSANNNTFFSKAELQVFIDTITKEITENEDWGKVAHYIPELAKVKLEQFAITICLPNGDVITSGQSDISFSIQSISKVFSLAIAQRRLGEDYWK